MSKEFPYEYVGGGYFRRKGVPKGEPAETLHGAQAVEYAYSEIERLEAENAALRRFRDAVRWNVENLEDSPKSLLGNLRAFFTPDEEASDEA
jgi:hypothetical protein